MGRKIKFKSSQTSTERSIAETQNRTHFFLLSNQQLIQSLISAFSSDSSLYNLDLAITNDLRLESKPVEVVSRLNVGVTDTSRAFPVFRWRLVTGGSRLLPSDLSGVTLLSGRNADAGLDLHTHTHTHTHSYTPQTLIANLFFLAVWWAF